ncbi:MAG: helix-turn-helix transcriptional regulator [Synergistaceae bacterium]|nr:helix-turn-helix transcriptional regulator [Synergistaceae bacterium]MBQ6434486.1 helix-turn-helix transcriptional regulator [Synergistaceae bacterium]MBQ6738725.1 helix-turn-helix transcriptional regulator [Synergistaceae bacterium]MBQ7069590.1 helix-turn-helix transcriptional regulator [Synergistaceae bacterium]MBR0076603.1 helix-turn-helix transcriptional regulator [Synergistaceae bacterium]
MVSKDNMPECPVATTVNLIGSKWKLLILRNLLSHSWRFNELKNNLSGISHKVLAESLRSMENDGLIIRRVYETKPRKVEYSLTELGFSLKPVLLEMEKWGNFYKTTILYPP